MGGSDAKKKKSVHLKWTSNLLILQIFKAPCPSFMNPYTWTQKCFPSQGYVKDGVLQKTVRFCL